MLNTFYGYPYKKIDLGHYIGKIFLTSHLRSPESIVAWNDTNLKFQILAMSKKCHYTITGILHVIGR